MIFAYNGFRFPNNRYRFEGVDTIALMEGFMPVGKSVTWNLYGIIQGANAADISNQIAALETIFSVHGGTAQWLTAAGVPTAHTLGGLSSRCGCKVIRPPSYEPAVGIEMGTRRTFRISLQAEYDVAIPNLVVKFHESVSFNGNGDPDIVYKGNVRGKPTRIQLCEATPVRVVQAGSITGRYRRVRPEEYVSQIFPGYRNGKECNWTPESPEERHGVPGAPVLLNWPTSYSWVYNLPDGEFREPNSWRN